MNKYVVYYSTANGSHQMHVWANSESEALSLAKQSLGWSVTIEGIHITFGK